MQGLDVKKDWVQIVTAIRAFPGFEPISVAFPAFVSSSE